MTHSGFFTKQELECPCCKAYFFDENTLFLLNEARERAGVPFIVSSACRCKEHNKEVGGTPNSAHLRGKAADILFKDSNECFLIVDALLQAGFRRLGINFRKKFIHADTEEPLPQDVLFSYE